MELDSPPQFTRIIEEGRVLREGQQKVYVPLIGRDPAMGQATSDILACLRHLKTILRDLLGAKLSGPVNHGREQFPQPTT